MFEFIYRSRDKHHSSSSSGKDKHRDKDRHSSHKSKDKDKDKDKHREHKSHSSSNGDGHVKEKKSSSHDKDRSKEHKSSSTFKHPSSNNSSSKHHTGSSSSKHHSSSSSKHHSSSSSSKHHSSSSHKSRDKDKDRHHSSKSSSNHDKDKVKKVATENGNQSVGPINNDITVIKEEHDPLDTSDYSFGENNKLQANGIRDCYVNVSQLSQASSCDYSMSQFRKDESDFVIKGDLKVDMEEASSEEVDVTNNDQNAFDNDDNDDVPIASRKKIKRELSDDEDEAPVRFHWIILSHIFYVNDTHSNEFICS